MENFRLIVEIAGGVAALIALFAPMYKSVKKQMKKVELVQDAEEPEKPWDASEPERAVTVDKISTNPDEIRNLYLEQGLLYFVGSKDVIQNKDKGLGYLTTAKNMGCADASYLLDTENPNGRINLYAALHGYAYARRNLESWQSTAKWRLTSDEWREFYTAFHPEKIEEEERKRKEEEERLRREEEERKRREEEERLRREEEERKRKEEEERLRREEEERKRKEEE